LEYALSLSFTITAHSGLACNYVGISTALLVPRQALDFDAGAPIIGQYRRKAPGVGGNWLIRDEAIARHIRVLARYMNATAVDADELYISDCAQFIDGAATIAALGFTYANCNIDMANVRRTRAIKGTGRHVNQCYFDVLFPFIQDSPT
jgi:hypothetical protein